jgi:hypothetical protein
VLPPSNLSDLNRPELDALLVKLFGEVAALKQIVGEQREEIARLKGLKGRPDIKPGKPSGMDNATEPPKPARKEKQRFRGKVKPRVKIEDQVIKAVIPEGSRFKGYEPFLVQDLIISAKATCYQRERWMTPDGKAGSRFHRHSRWNSQTGSHDPGAAAGGGRWSFRPRTAPLRADAVPSGTVDAATAGGIPALGWRGDLEAPASQRFGQLG